MDDIKLQDKDYLNPVNPYGVTHNRVYETDNMRFLYPRVQKLNTSNRYDLLDKEDTQEGKTSSLQEISKKKSKKHSYEDTTKDNDEDCRKDYNSSNSMTAVDYYQITKIHKACINKNTNCSGYPLCFNNSLLSSKILANNNTRVKLNNTKLITAPRNISNSDIQILNDINSTGTTTPITVTTPIFNACGPTTTKISVTNGVADAPLASATSDFTEMNNTCKTSNLISDYNGINSGTRLRICNKCNKVIIAPPAKTTPTPEITKNVETRGQNTAAVAASFGTTVAAISNIKSLVTTTPIAVIPPIFNTWDPNTTKISATDGAADAPVAYAAADFNEMTNTYKTCKPVPDNNGINLGTNIKICKICNKMIIVPPAKTSPTPEVIKNVDTEGYKATAVVASFGATAAALSKVDANIIPDKNKVVTTTHARGDTLSIILNTETKAKVLKNKAMAAAPAAATMAPKNSNKNIKKQK